MVVTLNIPDQKNTLLVTAVKVETFDAFSIYVKKWEGADSVSLILAVKN
jgi:hypothetical protein